MKIGRVTGPPGCGKTTEIHRLMGEAVKKYDPERIGGVSLTNAAVNEMKDRVEGVLGKGAAAKNIRTMHSLCFRLLQLNKDQSAEKNIAHWNETHPLYFIDPKKMQKEPDPDEVNYLADAPESPTYKTSYNVLAETMNLRLRMIPVSKWFKYQREFYEKWDAWKKENDFHEYTDMLTRVYEERLSPEIDVLFVDEAQDQACNKNVGGTYCLNSICRGSGPGPLPVRRCYS